VPLTTWPRAVTPFVGASDHLLFADRSIAIPAAHIAHWPDPAHHTSHDTVDRIDPGILARTTITCAAAVTALSVGAEAVSDIQAGLRRTAASRLATYLTNGDPAAAADHVRNVTADANAVLHRWHATTSAPEPPTNNPPRPSGRALLRTWSGPWNLHNLRQALDRPQRARLAALLDAGGRSYAQLAGLALTIDDHADLTAVIRRAQLTTGLHIDPQNAAEFISLMSDAGWVRLAHPAKPQD
jgi:hypothetical protein